MEKTFLLKEIARELEFLIMMDQRMIDDSPDADFDGFEKAVYALAGKSRRLRQVLKLEGKDG